MTESSELVNDIREILEKIGMPITHEDGNGYFEAGEISDLKIFGAEKL